MNGALFWTKAELVVIHAETKEPLDGAPGFDLVAAIDRTDGPVLAYRDGSGTWCWVTSSEASSPRFAGLELVLVDVVTK